MGRLRAATRAGVLLSLAVLPLSGRAEEIDLAAAMARARGHARQVAAAEARLEASEARLREAKAFRLPAVRLEEIWIRTDSPAEAFALTLNQERFSLAEFAAGDPNDPEAVESATTRLELSLPVYTGGEISARIDQAALASDAAQDRLSWTADGAALAAAQAYVQLAEARERVELLERSLETVRAHVGLARAYVEQGMLVRSELLRAQVEEARLRDLLTQARGQARVAEAALSFELAADPATTWELASLAPPAPLAEDLETWLQTAGQRKDLQAARQMQQVAELEAKVKRAALLPKVGVAVRQDLVDDSLFGSSGDSTSVLATASIDLFAGGRHRAARVAAQAEAEAAAHEVERFADGVALEVRRAYEEAVSARERHATALAALEAARETERITEERFRKGIVKTIDLLDASTARREAESRELVARAQARLATLQLAVTSGRQPETVLASPAAGLGDTR